MPSETGSFAFGDIVLVPFPFTNQTATKQRPAVVISGRAYNQARPDLLMMAVTSQLRPAATFGEVWLTDWRASGLLKPSAVKPVIATLEQGLVIRRLGNLSQQDQTALRQALQEIVAGS